MISTPSTITCPIQSSSPEPSLPSPLQPLLADKESKVPKEKQVTRNGQVEERRGYSGTRWHWARLFHKRPLQWDIDNIVRDGSTEAKRQKLVLFGCLMLMLIVHQQYRQREKERLIKTERQRDGITFTRPWRQTRDGHGLPTFSFFLPRKGKVLSRIHAHHKHTRLVIRVWYCLPFLSWLIRVSFVFLFCFAFDLFFKNKISPLVTGYGQMKASDICAHHLCECDRQFAECIRNYPCPAKKTTCPSNPLRSLG